MKLTCRLGKNIFVFDEWQFVSLWDSGDGDRHKTWVRFLLTMDGKPVVPKQSAIWADSPLPNWDSKAIHNRPRLEIHDTISANPQLFFMLSKFDFDELLDASLEFRKFEEELLPWPQLYTEMGDYEKAKRHCDRFIKTINNLTAFI